MIEIVRQADLNIGKKVHIPDERRPFLDNPPKQVVKMVFKHLE
jgi:hypothetical protein